MRTVRQLLESKAPEIHAIAPDAPVIDAIRLMAEKRIGAVVVLQGGALAGILSERDYARKIVLDKSNDDTAKKRRLRKGEAKGRAGGAESRSARGTTRGASPTSPALIP